MASTKLAYVAVKRQSSQAVAVVPTHFLRFQQGDIVLEREQIVSDPIQNNMWGALTLVRGKDEASGSYGFDLDANESVHWMAAGMGGLATADISSGTDASAFSQTITTATALPWLSIEQAWGDISDSTNNLQNYHVARAYGCRVDSFTIKGNDSIQTLDVAIVPTGIFSYGYMFNDEAAGSSVVLDLDMVEGLVSGETVNIVDDTPQNETDAIASLSASAKTITIGTLGNSYTKANNARVELMPLSPSFSTAPQLFSQAQASVQFGSTLSGADSASETDVETWEFQYMNNLEKKHGTIRAGYNVVESTKRTASFKFTKYFESKADHQRYMNGLRRAVVVTLTNGIRISATDTGLKKYQIQIRMSDVRFTSHQMQTGNSNLFYYQIEGTCFYDSSDARAVQIIVQNASAGTVYTA